MACLILPLRSIRGALLVAALASCLLIAPDALGQSVSVDSLYAQAVEADRAGDDMRAIALFTEVVARDSAHADAYFYRSAVFARQKDYRGAIQDLGHVQRLAPWFAGGFGNQGWYLIMAGRFAESRPPSERATELDSTAYYWPLNLGHAYLLDGDAEASEQHYEQAIRRITSRTELVSALADFDLFIDQGWRPAASRAYKGWLQTRFDEWASGTLVFRQRADSLFTVGELAFQLGTYAEAHAAFLESAEVESESDQPRSSHILSAWTKAGLSLYMQGLHEEALGPLQKALAVAEESGLSVEAGAIWALIGGAHREAQRLQESATAYERAVTLFEEAGDAVPEADLAFAMTQLAAVYSRTAEYRSAINYYGRVLEIRERHNDTAQTIDALYGLGVAHYAVGEYETSIAYLERAIALADADDVTSLAVMHVIIGSAYRDANRLDEAVEAYKQAIRLHESIGDEAGVASVANTLGSSLTALGQFDEAVEWHNRALDIHRRLGNTSDVALTFNKLGSVHHAMGDHEEALRYFNSAVEIAEQLGQEDAVAANLSGIGVASTALGRYDESHEALLRALELHERLGNTNEVASIFNNLSALFRAWGRFGEAIEYLERAAAIFEEAGAEIDLARALANLGVAYQEWSRHPDSIASLERAWRMFQSLGRNAEASRARGNMGETYRAQGRYDEALVALQEYLEVQEQLGIDSGIAHALNNIGVVFRDQGRYEEALASYERALALIEKSGLEAEMATIFNNTGDVYSAQGRYDEALASHLRALEIDERLGRSARVVTRLNNIGAVYRDWGRLDDALQTYRVALETAEGLDLEMETSVVLNNIGIVYDNWGRHEEALEYYRRGLAIDERLNRQAGVAASLNNIGAALRKLSRNKEALEYYHRALELDEQLGREGNIATDLNNIGLAHKSLGQPERALEAFGRALEISKRLGEDATAATILYNAGTVYHSLGRHTDAVAALNRSVEIHERLRLTAPGAARRDYLDDQIGAYRYLISAYVRDGQIDEVFASIERSRGRMLAERLADQSTGDNVTTITSVQQDLSDDTAVLIYANSGSLFSITALLVTRESSSAIEIPEGELLEYAMETYRPALDSAIVRSQRQSVVRRTAVGLEAGALGEQSDFDVLVQYYRELLTSVTTSTRGAEGVRGPDEEKRAKDLADLSGRLYQLLILPFRGADSLAKRSCSSSPTKRWALYHSRR